MPPPSKARLTSGPTFTRPLHKEQWPWSHGHHPTPIGDAWMVYKGSSSPWIYQQTQGRPEKSHPSSRTHHQCLACGHCHDVPSDSRQLLQTPPWLGGLDFTAKTWTTWKSWALKAQKIFEPKQRPVQRGDIFGSATAAISIHGINATTSNSSTFSKLNYQGLQKLSELDHHPCCWIDFLQRTWAIPAVMLQFSTLTTKCWWSFIPLPYELHVTHWIAYEQLMVNISVWWFLPTGDEATLGMQSISVSVQSRQNMCWKSLPESASQFVMSLPFTCGCVHILNWVSMIPYCFCNKKSYVGYLNEIILWAKYRCSWFPMESPSLERSSSRSSLNFVFKLFGAALHGELFAIDKRTNHLCTSSRVFRPTFFPLHCSVIFFEHEIGDVHEVQQCHNYKWCGVTFIVVGTRRHPHFKFALFY